MRLIVRWLCFCIALAVPVSYAQAQSPEDFFRRLFGPGQRLAADIEWRIVPPEEVACLDQALRQRGTTLSAMVRRGISPSDARLADLRTACRNGGVADTAGPSFACRGASRPDEVAICRDRELAQLDRSISTGFTYLRERLGERRARQLDHQWLRERRACFDDAACIKRVQLATIDAFAQQGAPIQPPDDATAGHETAAATPNPSNVQPPAAASPSATPQADAPSQESAAAPPVQATQPPPAADTSANPPSKATSQTTTPEATPSKDVRVILPGPVAAAEPRAAPTVPSPATSGPSTTPVKNESSSSFSPVPWLIGLILLLLGIIAALLVVIRRSVARRVPPQETAPSPSPEPVTTADATSTPATSDAAIRYPAAAIDLGVLAPTERPVDDVRSPGAPLETQAPAIAMPDETKPAVSTTAGDSKVGNPKTGDPKAA